MRAIAGRPSPAARPPKPAARPPTRPGPCLGELNYDGGDPECGYKVYIGPQQYFVITDIGRGRYQWYAFLARPADSEANEEKPNGKSPYLQDLFVGWSEEIHDILRVTQEHEIEQRDLYDRPPSVLFKPRVPLPVTFPRPLRTTFDGLPCRCSSRGTRAASRCSGTRSTR